MKYSQKCECCAHVTVAYTHRLNIPLVGALRRLVDEYERTGAPVLPSEFNRLGMSHNQQANFQKLRYFGMIDQSQKCAGWWPTKKGLAFIYGRTPAFDLVATIEGEPLDYSHPAWTTSKIKASSRYVHEIDKAAYKKHPEYAAEKSQQGLFNF